MTLFPRAIETCARCGQDFVTRDRARFEKWGTVYPFECRPCRLTRAARKHRAAAHSLEVQATKATYERNRNVERFRVAEARRGGR